MSLRTRRWLALTASFLFVAGACSGTATQAPATPAPPPASVAPGATPAPPPASQAPTSGDLKFNVDGEVTTFVGSPNDYPTSFISTLINSTMYNLDDHQNVVPWMASALPTQSADKLSWTIPLRDGLKFSDGSPITADDVKFSYDLNLSKNCGAGQQNAALCSDFLSNVDSVTVQDPKTVVIKLKQPFTPFLTIDLTSAVIVPKALIEASFQRFQQAAGAVDAAAVKSELDKVNTAMTDKACDGTDKQPATCNASTYIAEIEPLLQKAGLTLVDKGAYTTNGTLDQNQYGQGLIDQLTQLNSTLQSTAIDQIAASLNIIDFARAGNVVSAGPYTVQSYTAGQQVVLVKNPNYFRLAVGPNKVFIPIIKDAATASNALKQGDILWQYEITSDALPNLQNDPNLNVDYFPDFGYYYIAFNMRKGRLYSDQNLRTAFGMCIDHDKTVQAATDGQGEPVYSDQPPASWAYDPNVPKYTLDVAGAKALIEKSGWTMGSDGIYQKNGVRLSTVLYVRQGRPQRVAFGQLAKDQLKDCGIELIVKESDFAAVLLPLLSYPNNFDTYLGGWASIGIDPDDYANFDSTQITTKAQPDTNNFMGYSNPQADQLMVQGRQEFDQTKRKAIYSQIQTILHNDAPYYFLWADKHYIGLSKKVTSTEGPIDMKSYFYWWNNDSWVVSAQ